jgi:hypothetical protein
VTPWLTLTVPPDPVWMPLQDPLSIAWLLPFDGWLASLEEISLVLGTHKVRFPPSEVSVSWLLSLNAECQEPTGGCEQGRHGICEL